MPVIVQLGQCGNQIGSELTKQIWDHGDRDSFFTERQNGSFNPRSVLVDMEPKVLTEIINSPSRDFKYPKQNVISASSGSANNWSYGYSVHGQDQKDKIVRQVQKLAEDDQVANDGILMSLALAGGTGSGLGTRVCEELRDEFGKSYPILVHAVWPYETGEVVIQNYNILLSFSKLYNSADGLIFHSNTTVHDIIRYCSV